ncbi:cytochrome P450 family protein [Micromonospora echinofusca]|uniref:Cytochrome P450 n=1 Tax=Micromonospora echinofusca TaxID=47858 RepID=A0ABS3VXA4_MICEH|nr:cytochrome P450 [Micromonospora echinofusca]MBO4209177.1 cytochrome P450 [Micromonospora echinofusca]
MIINAGLVPIPCSADRLGEEYDRLRTLSGVHRAVLPDGSHAWLVTGHRDVADGLADPRLSLDRRHSRGGWSGFALPPALDANLLNMDPPDHTRIRRLVASAFSPQRVRAMRPAIRRTADGLLDELPFSGTTDLVAAFCAPLSVHVIADLLGIPAGARRDFRAWTDTLLATHRPDRQAARQAIVEMHGFVVELLARKREQPGADLLSALVSVENDDDRLSANELTSLAFLILFAGYENSANLIASTTLALLRQPEPLGRLDRDQLAAAVEETLRLDPPAPVAIRRFPVQDIVVDGTTIPAGDTVLLAIAAANRDSRVGVDNTGHLAFGRGVHHCIGAALARVEALEALDALASRLPRLALAEPATEVTWRPSFRTHGPAALPVTW